MASLSSGLNPAVVKTELDEVFMQEFEIEPGPQIATATDALVFRQSSVDNAAKIMEVFKGSGLWEERAEEQDVPQDTPRVDDKITYSVLNFAKSVDITKNFFDDDMHDVVGEMIRDFGEMARITQNDKAMESYRNSFTTFLTADGAALYSNTHTNINGDTVDNLEEGVLTEANLETMIVSLGQQINQAGVIRGHRPNALLVPMALFKDASEILDSELRQGTADNDINVYSDKYGIFLKQSPYLGATAGGSDSAHFLLARNHSVMRWERQGVTTDLVDWKLQRNNNYIYKGEYREMYGAVTYEGTVGSNGTV